MHWNIEQQLNGIQVTTTTPEFKQFLQFQGEILETLGIQPYRTEWRVAAPDLDVGGSIDFVGRQNDGTFVLVDWKRSKNLATSMYKSFGKYGRFAGFLFCYLYTPYKLAHKLCALPLCRAPLSHLPDCDGSKYSLQLNMYRYILGRYYDIDISRMMLGCFHPAMRTYFKAEVPVMDEEVDVIVKDLSAKRGRPSPL
jgi:hypothetical protein